MHGCCINICHTQTQKQEWSLQKEWLTSALSEIIKGFTSDQIEIFAPIQLSCLQVYNNTLKNNFTSMEIVHPSYAKKAIHRIGSLYQASHSVRSNPKHSTIYPGVYDIYKPIIYPLIEMLPHVGRSLENAPLTSWKSKFYCMLGELRLLSVFFPLSLWHTELCGSQPASWRAVVTWTQPYRRIPKQQFLVRRAKF